MTVHQDRIRNATLFVALATLLAPAAAAAQSREDLVTAARAFDESALRQKDNNALPMPVRKWTAPIRMVFDNPSAMPNLVEPTRLAIKYEAAEAKLDVIDIVDRADPSANYKVLFDENGLSGDAGSCFGSFWWNKSWQITRAELRINPIRIRDIDRCLYHEPMHTLGFGSHPHAALSVLSYVYKAQRTPTPLDLHLIHTLYDSRLTPGLKSRPASQLACRILGERLGSPAADIEAVCRDRAGPKPEF
jgi:hypothetical protein